MYTVLLQASGGLYECTPTPFHPTHLHLFPAAGKHLESLSFLLSRSVWADSADASDDTALHLAARAGSLPCVKSLIKAGASTVLVNRRGLTALGEAAVMGHAAVMVWMAESAKESGKAAGWAVKDIQGRR